MNEILTVIGARPQFIKAAPVSRALAMAGMAESILHTGQHYDNAMSGQFLEDLGLRVEINLAAGSGGHAHQTARMMTGIAEHLEAVPRTPDMVLVYGDTNSTVAAGLVAAKLGIPIAHVEAGLRSYNRAMPEEINRVITDHLSARLYCSSQAGVENLASEGIRSGVLDVGDVMLDAFETFLPEARAGLDLEEVFSGLTPGFVLATIHRPSNTDDPARLQKILRALASLDVPVLWPVHPRNDERLGACDVPGNICRVKPASYFQMLGLLDACRAVVTDSGGLQKEAYWARRPCVTVRNETEWVETLEGGWNMLLEPDADRFADAVHRTPEDVWRPLYGNGTAAKRIASDLRTVMGMQ